MAERRLLEGRTVAITGAGSGIGRGVAVAAAEEGAAVVATDLDAAAAEETRALAEGKGAEAMALGADVTRADDLERALDATLERFGGLDGWVNSAGILRLGPALEGGGGDWAPQIEVNARAVLDGSRAAARRMIAAGGGAIVNIASNAGKVGYPDMAVYNASKAAVISLTRSLAAEWAPHGINVNAVCPGGVVTPMLRQAARWMAERRGIDAEELLATMRPAQLGRHVKPIEVGRVVAFLLSERAAIIRGQAINVDGGDTPY